ncbi:G5 domain-containing protein [Demequina sp. SO4-13]|uniref:aggregation-promoting factor C-terminal-like domain-containing protein n=1 Tax=Demequina sp. SO4-13 TaxID=3401027 RepID=UPI003AF721E0
MSYRRTTPATGGRRDRRERTSVRMRRISTAAATIAIGAFAAGSFASVGVNAWAADETREIALNLPTESVAPVSAAAADLEVVVRTEEETLKHGKVEEEDPNELEGTSNVVTEGQDGKQLVSYTVTLKDGVEVERDEDMRVLVDEPVDEVIAVGSMEEPPEPSVASVPSTSNAGSNRALGRELAAQRGWTGEQWNCLNALFTKESNWNHTAANPSSGAYGIPQSLPGSKMGSVGSDWRTNPATQITWGLNYISGRYGTPCGAWGHSQARNWY